MLWLWVVLDPLTKLIPVLHLGARAQTAAHAVVHDLRQRRAPDCRPVFTSDGLNLYFYALSAHFGEWVRGGGERTYQWQVAPGLIYGHVKKTYRRRKVVQVTRLMRCGTPEALRAALRQLGLTRRLNTAFVERVNLTLRRSVAALAQLEWWRGYYHFVRLHASLRMPLPAPSARGGRRTARRYQQRTPAMAARLTSRRWTVRDLLQIPLPPNPIGAGC